MLGQFSNWNDTIVALATPPGIGAIGVIRVSGTHALELINQLFPKKDLLAQKTHTLHVGFLYSLEALQAPQPQPLDEVVLALYKAPKSFTGENVVEINCHGSQYIQQQIIQAICAAGARLAKPGEFTQRAFLNGKMDLTQAEAVADIIASNTEASKNAALHTMRGGFSHALSALRDQLISFSALIELELDFSGEDVEFADRTQLYQLLNTAHAQVQQLLQSFQLGNVIKQGVSVAIVGKPNAGKSTLLNQLLQEERAIVSSIAGTTRDTIEEVLNINGILFRLIDTAGIRTQTSDEIEQIGVAKSFEKIEEANLVVHLIDATEAFSSEAQEAALALQTKANKTVTVINKSDEASSQQVAQWLTIAPNALAISAKAGTGIGTLKEALFNAVVTQSFDMGNTVVTNARHAHVLAQIQEAITDILFGLNNHTPGDLIAIDIRRCLHYLGELTGAVTHEDQLDYIFSKF
ncbi:MAG: tRNA uridine-5-carboxymethylaminomethyl(34) synthesis GTPase MnmE, partial [Bacteroidetes bacterium]